MLRLELLAQLGVRSATLLRALCALHMMLHGMMGYKGDRPIVSKNCTDIGTRCLHSGEGVATPWLFRFGAIGYVVRTPLERHDVSCRGNAYLAGSLSSDPRNLFPSRRCDESPWP